MALTIRDMLAGAMPISTSAGSAGLHAAADGLRANRAQKDQREQFDRSQGFAEQRHADSQEDLQFKRGQEMAGKRREAALQAIAMLQSGDPAGRAKAEAVLHELGTVADVTDQPPPAPAAAAPPPAAPALVDDGRMPPPPPPPTALESVDEAIGNFGRPAMRAADMAPPPAPAPPPPAPAEPEPAPLARRASDMVPRGRGKVSIGIGDQASELDLGAVDSDAESIGEGFRGTLNESGVPTTNDLPPEFVAQARRIAGNDPIALRKILVDEAERRAKAKGDELDREAREAAAAAMARGRAASARGSSDYREGLEFDRGRKAAKDQLAQTGARGRANAATDIRATIDRMNKAPQDPRVYAAAVYGLARANEGPGARFTNQDFQVSGGVMDIFTEALTYGEQKLLGRMNQDRMEEIKRTLEDQLVLVERSAKNDYDTISEELEYQPSEATADGYASELRSAYGRLPFFGGNRRPEGRRREGSRGTSGGGGGGQQQRTSTQEDIEILRAIGVIE